MKWTKEDKFITKTDDIKIQYATLLHSSTSEKKKVPILFLTGWKETYYKYSKLLTHLHETLGYDVYTMDHRNQGFSDDTPTTKYEKGHNDGSGKRICYTNDFDKSYVCDIYQYVTEIIKQKVVILSFSMGGAISVRIAQLYPDLVSKMVLISPMLLHKNVLNIGDMLNLELPIWLSLGFGSFVKLLGGEHTKADGRDTNASIPTGENMTHCTEHQDDWNELRRKHPHIVLAGCSFGWALAALKMEMQVMNASCKGTFPKTIICMAEDDQFVYESALREFAQKNKESVTLIGPVKGSYHSLLLEEETITKPLYTLIDEFFEKDNELDVFKYGLEVSSKGDDTLRWKAGHHSGSWPPKYFPAPLILRNSPQLRSVLGKVFHTIAFCFLLKFIFTGLF